MPRGRPYWFPAKKRGWGWGLPTVWQGWLVLACFFGSLLAGAFALLPRYGQAAFIAYAVGLVLLLVGVCWVTGEPPGWRRRKNNRA